MILSDTDILSALAKVERADLLFRLFPEEEFGVTPGVIRELQHSRDAGQPFAADLFGLVATGRLQFLQLTPAELEWSRQLPHTLAEAEAEAISVSKHRNAVLLSNEGRVAHWCHQHGVACLKLPALLRAFWEKELVEREVVAQIVQDLQSKDRMGFRANVLSYILDQQAEQ